MRAFSLKTLFILSALILCRIHAAAEPVEYYLVPHFHWDLAYRNTESRYKILGNLLIGQFMRQAEIDPEYKFILDQVPLVKYYIDKTPGAAKKMKRLIAEGRLEISGAMYVQPDVNIPDGESLIRNTLYGARWFEEKLGARPRYLWNIDAFGQLYQIPQIAAGAGLEANVWSYERTDTNKPSSLTFEWVSPDGSGIRNQMLFPHYEGSGRIGWSNPYDRKTEWALVEKMMLDLNSMEKRPRYISMCGADFTAPPPSLSKLAKDWNENHSDSKLIIATPADFFKADRAAMEGAPRVTNTEFQVSWNGFLSNIIEDKLRNRRAENLLRQGEAIHTWMKLFSGNETAVYPQKDFEKLWIMIIENTFHDLAAGSTTEEARKDLEDRFAAALSGADILLRNGTAFFAGAFDTASAAPAGAGSSIALFNTLSFKRKAVVEMENNFTGDFRLTDSSGAEIPYQFVDSRIVFIADLPAMGWKTFYAVPGKPAAFSPVEKIAAVAPGGTAALKGPGSSFTVILDEKANITSLTAGTAAQQLAAPGKLLNELCSQPDSGTDYDYAPASSKHFRDAPGRLCSAKDFTFSASLRTGPVLTRLVATGKTGASDVIRDTRVYNSLERIDNIVSVDWRDEQQDLYTVFNYAVAGERTDSVPLGFIRRTADGRFPIAGWGDWGSESLGATILTRGLSDIYKRDATLYMTLLRSVSTLDNILPTTSALSKGKHEMRYSIIPRAGGIFEGRDPYAMSQDFNDAVPAEITGIHAGRLPAENSLLETPPSCAATALFIDGGKTVLRVLETTGSTADAAARISLPGLKSAQTVNLMLEKPESAGFSDGALKLKLSPQKALTFVFE